jgi:hypothetical protein
MELGTEIGVSLPDLRFIFPVALPVVDFSAHDLHFFLESQQFLFKTIPLPGGGSGIIGDDHRSFLSPVFTGCPPGLQADRRRILFRANVDF